MSKSLDNDTLETLEELNEDLKLKGLHLRLAIIGGTLGNYHLGDDYRSTMDIDILTDYTGDEIGQLLLKHGLDIPHVSEVPPSEELVLEDSIDLSNLKVNIPNIEMFAVFKLMTSRGKDYKDLEEYPILDKCDIEKVKSLVEDYKDYIVSPNNPDLNFKRLDELIEIRKLNK